MPSDLYDYPAAEIVEVIRYIVGRDAEGKEENARASLDRIARDTKGDKPEGPKVLGRKA